jgi:AraC-like DNA-binding protein
MLGNRVPEDPGCLRQNIGRLRPGARCLDGTVPIQSAQTVVAAAAGRTSVSALCASAGLEPATLADPAARVPISRLVALYEAAARLTGDASFGLGVGSRVDLRSFGLLGYIALNSATVGQALRRIARYFALWTEGARFRWEADGTTARFAWEYRDEAIREARHDCEMSLLAAARLGFRAAPDWRPLEVHVSHAPPRRDTGDQRRAFRAPVHFRMPTNALILDRKALETRIAGGDRALGDLLAGYAEGQLVVAPESLASRARAALQAALGGGRPTLPRLARRMGLSERSLQRKLAEEGVSFRELTGAVRREVAEQHLRDVRLPIARVADALGFATVGEFQRAFRLWTGLTPSGYRRELARRSSGS